MPRVPHPKLPHSPAWTLDLGATIQDSDAVRFRVWAPHATQVDVQILNSSSGPIPLTHQDKGFWEIVVPSVGAGTRYRYILNGVTDRPDPASRFQPEGVHGPSEIVDPQQFQWTDQEWKGLPFEHFIIYELHTGTFTAEGTFDAIIPHLSYLRHDVGVTAIELLPVAQCPGARNWGYDGTYLFAPQASYGGPDGLKRLIDACHAQGLAVIMDVVYNHLGPEGNYIGDFGPFFTHRYPTPWGQAINYDGPGSDAVRHFIISNAVYWIREFHIDALRLDAIHGIFDFSAYHVLQELGDAVHQEGQRLGRQVWVIAESDLNDARVITPVKKGGYGLDGQWSDDFHHALHCLLTGEHQGYYQDFGKLHQFAKALRDHFIYSEQYSAHRHRRHGNSAKGCRPSQFVVFAQNHDQIGNRAQGDRLSMLVPPDALKVAAAAVLLSPNIPLLFMGEEYGETAPFLYFIDHGDPVLIEAVRQGRLAEFEGFGWKEVPDPYALETFQRSRLKPMGDRTPQENAHIQWCRALITLRQSLPALGTRDKTDRLKVWTFPKPRLLVIYREGNTGPDAFILLGFNHSPATLSLSTPEGIWVNRLDSGDQTYGGSSEASAPPTLQLGSDGITLTLPPYPAWVYIRKT